jgi:hypothetical protein
MKATVEFIRLRGTNKELQSGLGYIFIPKLITILASKKFQMVDYLKAIP